MLNKKSEMFKGLRVLCVVVLAASLLCACGSENAETTAPVEATQPAATIQPAEAEVKETAVLTVESITEQEDVVVVKTSYCEVKYPFAFADLIRVRAEGETLRFVMELSGEEHPLFAICFGEGAGIPLGTLQMAGQAEPMPVWAEIASPNEAVLGDSVNTYFAAQESFNDVVSSLMENAGFTAAQ